ncbi:hypothetical protein AALA78_03055 [Lachnospiraceae bacterium 42-17]|jgi:hypothetical protein
MKIYVLCSYSDGLTDPDISTDYQALYEKMEKSYRMTLNGVSQTEDDKENTYLSGFSARAVIQGDWIEWSITELELPDSTVKAVMTDLKSDIQNERIQEKIPQLEICFSPEPNNPYPLCIGKGMEKCKECQLRADWEPDDPYGINT